MTALIYVYIKVFGDPKSQPKGPNWEREKKKTEKRQTQFTSGTVHLRKP